MFKANRFLKYWQGFWDKLRKHNMNIIQKRSKIYNMTPIFKCVLICLGGLLIISSVYAENHHIYVSKKLIDAKWGLVPEEFGLIAGEEIEKIGPLTFTLDEKGNIYILDFVKKHIKKFDKEGTYLGNLGTNITGSAIAVGKDNQLFVLDDKSILEYSPLGELIEHRPIASEIKMVQGYGVGIRIDIDNNLYYHDSQKTSQLGRARKIERKIELLNEKTQLASEKKGSRGITENNWFQSERKSKHSAVVRILNNKDEILNEISMDTKDVFGTILFLGQDENRNIYVEVGRITDKYIHLEVWKYDLKGNLLSRIELPNDYFTTVFKKIEVDEIGNIYQMLTTPKGVEVIKWEQK